MLKRLLRQGFHASTYLIADLILNTLFSLAFIIVSPGFLIALPFLLLMQDWDRKQKLQYALMAIALLPCAVFLWALGLLYFLLVDPIKMVIMGLVDGWNNPLDNFFENFWFAWKYSLQGLIIESIKEEFEEQFSNQEYPLAYNYETWEHLIDEPKTPSCFDASTIQMPKPDPTPGGGLLTDKELTKAHQLMETQGNKRTKLQTAIERYNHLLTRLEALDKAIAKRGNRSGDLEDLTDECISMTPMSTVVLFQKLYEKKPATWKVVPQSTFITDETNIREWLELHEFPTHPVTRDPIVNPEPYKKRTAGYGWHFYQGESQELHETAKKIRSLSEKAEKSENSCFGWLKA